MWYMNPSKRNAFIAISAFFAVLAVIFLLWGGALAGWDIAGWFTSTQAYVLYALLVFYALFVIGILVHGWVNKR